MASSITFRKFLSLSFFLFSMFLGAGNIIFAPPLGQEAGTNTWIAMSGFLITGVGLVMLAIMALSIAGGSIDSISIRVGPSFAKFFSVLTFLALGPIYVIPRTAAVVYEVSIVPFVPGTLTEHSKWVLLVFSILFIGLTVYLTLEPKKFVSRVGSVIAPTFIVMLIVIVSASFINPMGIPQSPSGPYLDNAFGRGFTQGYYTMDVLAAFVFGRIFLDSMRHVGVGSQNLTPLFVRTGLFTVVALALVQLALAGMGASSGSALGVSRNGGEALTQIGRLVLGDLGVILLASVVFMTGWTTAIACLASVAEYFSRVFTRLNYRGWTIVLALLSLVITNFGLTSILRLASPVLLFLYPVSITLIALVFTNKWFDGQRAVYVGATVGAGIMGLADGLKDMNWLPQSLDQFLNSNLPLYASGLGWVTLAVVGALAGLLAAKLFGLSGTRFHNQPIAQ